MNSSFWSGKKVFITGHSGFKGSWLTFRLQEAGAQVTGYSLPPNTETNLFTALSLSKEIHNSHFNDVRDLKSLSESLEKSQAEIIFHLAAQPLVRVSYENPVDTFATNLMGTVNILEAARHSRSVKAILNVTTDKVYANEELGHAFKETEALGGKDPYSSSKACSELITSAYRNSFLKEMKVAVATARAGNVIGGGDWSKDRLVPDLLRAFQNHEQFVLRNPTAVRPWQHVLESIAGYIALAEKLYQKPNECSGAYNFGPRQEDCLPVERLVQKMICFWDKNLSYRIEKSLIKEANLLKLDSQKAHSELAWTSHWSLDQTLERTLDWYKSFYRGEDMIKVTRGQIQEFERQGPKSRD